MGVRRAVELVLDASNRSGDSICTYGPLIHNPQVLDLLEEKGISVINEIPDKGTGTVLIRAHGVPPLTLEKLIAAGFSVIDATCPRVIKVQTIIKKHHEQGYDVIIVGDRDHPEVVGLLGYAGGKGYVVSSQEGLDGLPSFDKAIIVAQTTQNTNFFENVKNWAAINHPGYKVFNTICDSTEKRQKEIKQIAETVDAVVVVGGYNSGNTRRLYEIAKQTGKRAFHIEQETELDIDYLSTAGSIGITAGASTPNWIIKKVFRKVETLPFSRMRTWQRIFYALQLMVLRTNTYVALGAGCLSFACTKLQGIEQSLSHTLISVLYILSMHTLNNLTGKKAAYYNDPDRALFYERNLYLLAAVAISSGGVGLAIAFTLGPIPFLILFIMSLMGLSYNLKLIPENFSLIKYKRIRDLPGSKTILMTLAWGVVTSLCPSLSETGTISLGAVIVFIWASGMVFVRTAFFDILDMQGDRIVGKETIPLHLGEKLSMRLLKYFLVFLFLLMMTASALNLVTSLGFFLQLYTVSMFWLLLAHERGNVLPGFRLEFLVDSQFFLAGIIAFIWFIL